jgi:hypothetical protein
VKGLNAVTEVGTANSNLSQLRSFTMSQRLKKSTVSVLATLTLGIAGNTVLSALPAIAGGRTSVEICNNTTDTITAMLTYSENSRATNNDFATGYWAVNPDSCRTATVSYSGIGGGVYGHGFVVLDDGDIYAHEPEGGNSESFCA